MKDLAALIDIYPEDLQEAAAGNKHSDTVDETHLLIDLEQLDTLVSVVNAANASLQDLQGKSAAFEDDIKHLSVEMNALQTHSASLHNRLVSRDRALAELEPLIERYIVPGSIVSEIFSGDIGPQFRAALQYVLHTVREHEPSGKSSAGATRLRHVLIMRTVERVKAFYVQKLRTLRRPGVNAQVVQAELVNNGELMRFLQKQTPRLAAGLEKAYKNTMRWYYTMLFGKYGRWLDRQPLAVMDSVKPLGSVVSASGARASMFTMSMSAAKQVDTFNIGARPTVLHFGSDAAPPLALTSAPASSSPYYPVEVLVRSMLMSLSDSFSVEASVGEAGNWGSLNEVFEPTLLFYEDLLSKWVAASAGDTFGLLLIVRITHLSPLRRWIPDWFERIEDRCWPRIVSACEAHAKSIEAVAIKPSTVSHADVNAGPHPMTQLVSAFLSGVLQLCPSTPEQKLSRAVHSIVEAYELFISKLGAGNERVLYNNYFVMSALLSDIEGPLAAEFARHFELLVDAYKTHN